MVQYFEIINKKRRNYKFAKNFLIILLFYSIITFYFLCFLCDDDRSFFNFVYV